VEEVFSRIIQANHEVSDKKVLEMLAGDLATLSRSKEWVDVRTEDESGSDQQCVSIMIDLPKDDLIELKSYLGVRIPELVRNIRNESSIVNPHDTAQFEILKSERIECDATFEIEDGQVPTATCFEWRLRCKKNELIAKPVWLYTFRDDDGILLGHSSTTLQKFGLQTYIGTRWRIDQKNSAWANRLIMCRVGDIRRAIVPFPTTRHDVKLDS
jgi:hypothetical protein